MNTIIRRSLAAAALLAAPVVIALGTAAAGHADTVITHTGPSSSISHPVPHQAFPHQFNTPQPGTAIHHHHQNR
jgi:hypothetical protein